MKTGMQAKRKSVIVLIVAALLLELTTAVQYFSMRDSVTKQIKEKAQHDLNMSGQNALQKQEVELKTAQMVPVIERHLLDGAMDSLRQDMRQLLQLPQVAGVDIAYVPGILKPGLSGIYLYKSNGRELEHAIEFDYTKRTWYSVAIEGSGFWSEPYESNYNVMLMSTYSLPLRNAQGKTVAVVGADVPMRELSEMAEQLYENQNNVLMRIIGLHLVGLLVLAFIIQRSIRSINHLQEVNAEKERIENELNIARGIQMAILPRGEHPYSDRTDLDIYASLTPAKEVGGDFYDYLIRDHRLYFCIGDVTGKGVPAALLMMETRSLFRSEAGRANNQHTSVEAADIVQAVNRTICDEQSMGFFATVFVGVLNLENGHLNYCNAGHEAPLLNGVALPVKPNLPVGALPDWIYEGQTVNLATGDKLFLYTDGLSEARNKDGQQLSRKRVFDIAQQQGGCTIEAMVRHFDEVVRQHTGEGEQSDDITLMAISWNGTAPAENEEMSIHSDKLSLLVSLSKLKAFVLKAAEKAGLSLREAKRLRLAVEETVANVSMHGEAQNITIATSVSDNVLSLTITDDGIPFDPTTAPLTDQSMAPEERPVGGLGLVFMRQMSDALEYRREDGKNILTIKKIIHKT